jgi:MoaA/NifB/PqqE/SkfB family radical SAM enzyme
MLQMFDGSLTVDELLGKTGWVAEGVYSLIDRLVSAGILKLAGKPMNPDRRGWIKTSRLMAVSLEVIQRCNQNCLRCYLQGIKSPAQQLTLAEIERIFLQLVSYGVNSVSLSGGEPFLREDLMDIVRLARENGLEVIIASNGTLLTPRRAAELARLGVRVLQLSVNGLERTHDRLRRSQGAFTALKQAFRVCAAAGLQVYAITDISGESAEEIGALNRLLADWGAHGHLLVRYVPSGVAEDDFRPLSRDRFFAALKTLREATPVVSCDPVINRMLGRDGRCGAGYYGATITTDGEVKLCDALPCYVGNVRERSIGDIFESSALIGQLGQRHQKLDARPQLAGDPHYGCMAYQYLASGSIEAEDSYHPAASPGSWPPPRAASAKAEGVPYVSNPGEGA